MALGDSVKVFNEISMFRGVNTLSDALYVPPDTDPAFHGGEVSCPTCEIRLIDEGQGGGRGTGGGSSSGLAVGGGSGTSSAAGYGGGSGYGGAFGSGAIGTGPVESAAAG